MRVSRWIPSAWTPWAYAVICAPLVLLLIEFVRGAIHDTQQVRVETLRAEMRQLQSHALQRATGLSTLMQSHTSQDEPWKTVRDRSWFNDYWAGNEVDSPHQLYAAIVDDAGNIVMHTDRQRIGRRLERGWYERQLSEIGPNVVAIQKSTLSGEQSAFDVTVPLDVAGQWLGDYHEGLDGRWLDAHVADLRRGMLTHWVWLLLLVIAVDAAAAGGLIFLARTQWRLWQGLRGGTRQRARQLAQLGSGLAHEIRNPLHALRINLHTLKRAFGGRSSLPEEQLVATIQESNSAIDRLDSLMRDLLQFSDPTGGQVSEVDVIHEVQATLALIAEHLRRDQIEVRTRLSPQVLPVEIDPAQLRQAVLNLLTHAQNRAGRNGRIEVVVEPVGRGIEIAVADSGPKLTEDQRSRVFEPFQAPAETGSGLGLALIQVYVEEAGGRARWDAEGDGDSRCRLWLPLATHRTKGGQL
jgi:signal transduction histidine kinase